MGQKSKELWLVLETFWGKEATEECQRILFGSPDAPPNDKSCINGLGNLITLAFHAQAYWSDGVLALKHIRGGSCQGTTEMVLELVWLADHPEVGSDLVGADRVMEDTSLLTLTEGLWRVDTHDNLRSGYQITLTTTDRENYPLPDERLIHLRWLLARVLRMSRANKDKDLEHESDSPTASPMAPLMLSRTESLKEAPMETPVVSPLNSSRTTLNSRNAASKLLKPSGLPKPIRCKNPLKKSLETRCEYCHR
jgi:hypothetical protein